MQPMRPDQVQDFFKHLIGHMKSDGDLPREIREGINNAVSIKLSVSEHRFEIQYVDEDLATNTYSCVLPSADGLELNRNPSLNWSKSQ